MMKTTLLVVLGSTLLPFLCCLNTTTVQDVRQFVIGSTLLLKQDFYVTITGNKPLKEHVTLDHYALQDHSVLYVNICGIGGSSSRAVVAVDENADKPNRENPREFLVDLPTAEHIQAAIAARYDELIHVKPDGSEHPLVCFNCDEFLTHRRQINCVNPEHVMKIRHLFEWGSQPDPNRTAALEEYYKLPNQHGHNFDNMAFSPRGIMNKKNHHRAKQMLYSCNKCYQDIVKNKTLPLHSIVNRNYVGATPQCLLDLTDIEIAFLTPTKSYGFTFVFNGGAHQCLKGTMTLMRILKRKIARAGLHLEALGLNDHVIVLAEGNMTPGQHAKAKEYATIRVDYVLAALMWLCENNHNWRREVDIAALRAELERVKPVFVDRSRECKSVNRNVEEEELFTAYFPEDATTPDKGGCDSREEFRSRVEELKKKGFEVEFKCNLEQTFLTKDDECITDMCILQFPYGLGGFRETRTMWDGSYKDSIDIISYLQHLTKVSQPVFQKPLFQLVAYNYFCRAEILRTSRFKLKGNATCEALANGVNYADLTAAVDARRRGNYHGGTRVSKTVLDACKLTARHLPHSNEAATYARGNGEAMQHHFGIGSIWLTCSFDDNNSWLMQVYSGLEHIDDGTPVEQLTDAQCRERCTHRQELRLKYPGLSALYFEMMLEIAMEEVIGWDMELSEPTGRTGLCGEPFAVCLAAEEQKRKTPHAHLTIWIKGFKNVRRDAFFGTKEKKRDARTIMAKYQDQISSTSMMTGPQVSLRRAFDHKCTHKDLYSRMLPTVVTDQELRNLRCRKGWKAAKGRFAYCTHCAFAWTYEELLSSYLIQHKKLHHGTVKPEGWTVEGSKVPIPRLFQEIIKYQMSRPAVGTNDVFPPPVTSINATYNHHASKHVDSCFKCKKGKKRKHTCSSKCECRYRMPDRKRIRPTVQAVPEATNKWFEYSGAEVVQPILEFLPRRSTYDLFQNVTCPAISHSKMACNTNIQVVTDGPLSQYQFKYQLKRNQEEETAEYSEVLHSINTMQGRVHPDNDRAEAARVLQRVSFAHAKTNIIAPAFAGFLTRRKSRFYFSHEFVWCPLPDLIRLQDEKPISGTYQFGKNSFFENQALHYICRPLMLEDCCVKDFFEHYEIVFLNKWNRDDDEMMFFEERVGPYRHPAWRGEEWKQGVRLRDKRLLLKVAQKSFPDTAGFKSNLLTCDESNFVPEMETYSQLVLTLFHPHRGKDDLTVDGSAYTYTKKFRDLVSMENQRGRNIPKTFMTDSNTEFLQNVQNCAYNSLRYKLDGDDLGRSTQPFKDPEDDSADVQESDSEEDDDEDEHLFDDILPNIQGNVHADPHDTDPERLSAHLQNLSFQQMRFKGKEGCGYNVDFRVPNDRASTPSVLSPERDMNNPEGPSFVPFCDQRRKYRVNDVVELLFRRSVRRARGQKIFPNNPSAEVQDATGSVRSIQQWCEAAKLDKIQERAFQSICAAFLLTFHDPPDDDDSDLAQRLKARRAKNHLKRLRGTNSKALIMLLHGPGGSGKSTVIDLVIEYAREFCKHLGHPFTSRTICVTACSGVAATLILGETVHSAFALNSKKIPDELYSDFADCRLVFIDEISMLPKNLLRKLDQTMRALYDENYKRYGGQNVIFAGDFSQLEPVNGTPVYSGEQVPEFHEFLNAYVELNGMHRFRDDPDWGHMNMRFRFGKPKIEDILKINDECLVEPGEKAPQGVQMATFANKERDALNCAVFDKYCENNKPLDGSVLDSALLVLMDGLMQKNPNGACVDVKSNTVKKYFYENCGEDSLNVGGDYSNGRLDPVLKLYHHCPLMYTKNSNVLRGEANGSRVIFERAFLKYGENPFTIQMANGVKVHAVYASQLKCLRVHHLNERINPETFDVKPETWTFTADLKVGSEKLKCKMKGNQIGLISNSATTGHKLQGCTVRDLLVIDWKYAVNWVYVVLSRVRTMKGLRIKKKLSLDMSKYAMSADMADMIRTFRSEKTINEISDEELNTMLRFCEHNT